MISCTHLKTWLFENWPKPLTIPSVLCARKLYRQGEAHPSSHLSSRLNCNGFRLKWWVPRIVCTGLSKLIITRFKYTG